MLASTRPRRPVPLVARLALIPLVAGGLILLAVLLVGQVLPGSEEVKIALTVGILLGAGLVLGKLVKPRAELRWPMRIATVGAGLLVLGWYVNSLRGEDVQERLVTAAPPAAATRSGERRDAARSSERPAGPILLSRGRFRDIEHAGSGGAELVRDGRRTILQLRDFDTDGGPDLRVYLSTDDGADDFVDLGGLKGTSGNQRYTVPRDADLDRLDTVLVWCRAFSVPFTAATLRRA
jgi:hypothetical protein